MGGFHVANATTGAFDAPPLVSYSSDTDYLYHIAEIPGQKNEAAPDVFVVGTFAGTSFEFYVDDAVVTVGP